MDFARCPDRDVLSAYGFGRLAAPELAEISDHVEHCASCQAELATLDGTDDTLVEWLRAAAEESCLREPLLDVAMEEAAQLPARLASPRNETTTFVPGVLGEYQLVEEIGRGGMGHVYRARHTKLDREVAVKILPRGRWDDPRAIARFEREMRAVGRLNHPHVVHAYDAREIDQMPVLIMEFVDGMDLEELARRLGPLRTADACEVIRQTALGLQYAHEHGLVHRDIKPSNIMLTHAGHVKLLDLGLARFAAEPLGAEMTHSGQLMGTADYVAPEQVSDSRTVDIRADIYSLGCTLYRLLAGRVPYGEPDYRSALDKFHAHVHHPIPAITQVVPEVPAELETLLRRMLAKRPDDRPDTPRAVVELLTPWCGGANTAELVGAARQIGQRPAADTERRDRGAPRDMAPPPRAASARNRGARRWFAIAGLLLLVSASFAAGVIITIYRDGKATRLEVPDGSEVRVGADGNVDVTLSNQPASVPDASPTDLQALQGVWRVEAVFRAGRALPKEQFDAMTFAFVQDRFQQSGVASRDVVTGRFELDPTAIPKTIDIHLERPQREAKSSLGIYKLEGNHLWLALSEPGDERPTSLTMPGEGGDFQPDAGRSSLVKLRLRRTDQPAPTLAELDRSQAAAAELEAATRNRLRPIAIAMHMYHDLHGSFPPAVLVGPDGTTPHSWRVALLPLLGHQALYDQYRRDEPWDSPHNLQLLEQMPDVYRAPTRSTHSTQASLFALVGPGTINPSPHEASRIADVIDGTSRTIMLVQVARDIPWTKPEDIAYDVGQPLPALGGFYRNGFHAVFADGAIRFLSTSLDEPSLRAWISAASADRIELPPPATPEPLPDPPPTSPSLSFRIAPVVRSADAPSENGHTALSPGEVEQYVRRLHERGPGQYGAGAGESESYAWFELAKPVADERLVTAPCDEKTYLLLSQRPGDVLLGGVLAESSWKIEEFSVTTDELGYVAIEITLDVAGGEALQTLTRNHLGDRLAILADDRVVTVARVVSPMERRVRITGNFSQEEARAMEQLLRSGETAPETRG